MEHSSHAGASIELVLGKLILFRGMFDVLLAVLMTELVFQVPCAGNLATSARAVF